MQLWKVGARLQAPHQLPEVWQGIGHLVQASSQARACKAEADRHHLRGQVHQTHSHPGSNWQGGWHRSQQGPG
eukprot:16242996-Heterocapsa_arctica.AAC.1